MRELERFEQTADDSDPRTPRTRRKLHDQVEKAQRDLRPSATHAELE
jgi:hypothetical protein